MIAIGILIFYAFRVLRSINVAVVAVIIALFLASVLWKPTRWLMDEANWPPLLASLRMLTAAVAGLFGLLALTVPPIASNITEFADNLGQAWDSVRRWLRVGPLGLSEESITNFSSAISERFQQEAGNGFLIGAVALAEFFGGLLLAVIVTFFVLKDGRTLVNKLLGRLSPDSADKVETSLRIAWRTLSQYMAGVATVGLFDAALIAIGLWIVGVPLVLPLSVLVFIGAFFPLVGAFASGLVAVTVAYVNGGLIDAMVILGVVIVVQQVEGDVIMPMVFGQALRLHPVIVLLGVAAGGLSLGLLGAFLAVPLISLVVSIWEALSDEDEGSLGVSLARG